MSPERILCELAQSKRMSRFRERHFYGNFRKHATPQNTDTYFAREHAQSKRMSRLGKDHFMQIYRKKAAPRVRTLVKNRPLQLP